MSLRITPPANRPGHVYCLVNPSIPGKVKVGMTTRDPATRARELHTTGTPRPFEVLASWPVFDVIEGERAAHGVLERYRVSGDREWFQVDPEQAVALVGARLAPAPSNGAPPRARRGLIRGAVEAFGWFSLALIVLAFIINGAPQ